MPRTIKFKVSDGQKIIGYEMIEMGRWFISASGRDWEDGTYYGERIKRWQYTGKRDASNKEIYEGDITEFYGIKKMVYWREDSGGWGLKRRFDQPDKTAEQLATVDLDKTVVVGTVYSNPEMLVES